MRKKKKLSDETILASILDSEHNLRDLVRLGEEPEDTDAQMELPKQLTILPLRNTVLFRSVVVPVTVGRLKSLNTIKQLVKNGQKYIGVCAQKNIKTEEPQYDDLYEVGTLAKIIKVITGHDGSTTIIIQGKNRFRMTKSVQENPYLVAEVEYLTDIMPTTAEAKRAKVILKTIRENAQQMIKLNPDIPDDAHVALDNITSLRFMVDFLSSNIIHIDHEERQALLTIDSVIDKAVKLLEFIFRELDMLEIKSDITNKTHHDIEQQQRDYFLRQQIKVLQDELGDDTPESDLRKFKERAAKKKWPEPVAKHFKKEADRLGRTNSMAPDYAIGLNYLEFMLDLPWQELTKDNLDLERARKVLDKDHFGLEKVKDRIIEFLAVLKLTNSMKGPILCLLGPPGVGKTSLGKSIAKALGRKYVRMSLGGVRDEAEIRGHRRTYIGAMPGRIVQNIKKAGAANPVFILDELDKVGADFRGDPASALLEVLDPEQNNTFNDHYLEVDYDLSKVLFIATANSLDSVHPALRDRMEVVQLSGYTQEEKLQIAKNHLVSKIRKEHGLTAKQFNMEDSAIEALIQNYTLEAGVRKLSQQIAALARKTAIQVAKEPSYAKKITAQDLKTKLGVPVFEMENYEDTDVAGVVTGLAWTPLGGDVLHIESSLSKGKGKLILSGYLGNVMKESATTALSYLKAHDEQIGIDSRLFNHYDLHIHVPSGAVPKDGPSAGITMLTSMASTYTQRKIKPRLAMTGEITLTGRVLPVGGIKEKILAAKRAGIWEIILCYKNQKDLEDIEEVYRSGLTIYYVKSIEEVLQIALLEEKVLKPLNLVISPQAGGGMNGAAD
ncbi:MAG: endopeptidase La [Cytophagales bacterium]|nr:MAG: endopeptidase La [Cytophagales bacterium]TAF62103.1 MAG: endopeptidase La [Cytophagales bacterium]